MCVISSTNKTFVPMHKKSIPTDKTSITIDQKSVTIDKKFVPADKKFVPAEKNFVAIDNNHALFLSQNDAYPPLYGGLQNQLVLRHRVVMHTCSERLCFSDPNKRIDHFLSCPSRPCLFLFHLLPKGIYYVE